ncbi:hypothetical protein [Nocardia salmonicida]|uniref:hypothetical protein n=1 Tax=Nocardia salmonicida TaxID=53431 RepID=UPI0033EE6093
MDVWKCLIIIVFAGALGGALAALLGSDKGLVGPTIVQTLSGPVLRPGFIGLMTVGAAAAAVNWGLNSPVSSASFNWSYTYGLPMREMAGAVLIGLGGSKWLSSSVDLKIREQSEQPGGWNH